MPVTQSAASAFQQNDFLTVLGYIAYVFTGFGIVHYRAAGHFDDFILSVLAETAVLGARLAVACHDVAVVAQVQQGPVVAVAAENHVAASSSVTSVGAAIGNVFSRLMCVEPRPPLPERQ